MNTGKRRLWTVMLLTQNLLLVVAVVFLFITYVNDYKAKLFEQNLNDILNINQASAQISSEFVKSRGRKLNNITKYLSINKLDVYELLKFLDDIDADADSSFQLLGPDYTGYVAIRDENGQYPSISYRNSNYAELQKIVDAASYPGGDSFMPEFTDQHTAARAFARYIYVPVANDNGSEEYYTLLAVSSSNYLLDMIRIDGGYEGLSTVLINNNGDYLLRNSDFKSENLFQYLYLYNDLTLDEMNALKKRVVATETGAFQSLNSWGNDCVFVYTVIPQTQWFCVSSVPVASFHTSALDMKYTIMLVGVLAMMMGLDFYYLSRLNKQLKVNAQKALAASEAKTDFLSRMSHDIRTPINVITGMTELAMQEDNPAETMEYLDGIRSSGRFLLGLVNDILDMNKVESGKMELHPKPYGFAEFHTYVNAVIMPLCAEKHIEFKISCSDTTQLLMVDNLRLNQIFFNLLTNAVKFTPEHGHISLDITLQPVSEHRMSIDFSVKDDGVGMSRKFQDQMFDAFAQEEKNIAGNAMGTGLGLAIVKRLVELMGGTVWAQSEEGKGTTFFVHFEADTADPPPQQEQHGIPTNLSGACVLLCEDHPLNTQIIVKLLSRQSVRVETAENGKLGVDMFKASEEGYYDAILMDIRMPVMNGLDATKAIRAMPGRNDAQSVPIIALTANAYALDIKACFDAGMDAHLSKPIDSEMLYDTLVRFIRT